MWQLQGMPLGDYHIYEAHECQAFRIGNNFMFRWGPGPFKVSYVDQYGDFIWDDVVTLDSLVVPAFASVLYNQEGSFVYRGGGANSKVDTSGYIYWPNRPNGGEQSTKLEICYDGYGGLITVWGGYSPRSICIGRTYADGHVGGDTLTSIEEDNIPKEYNLTISCYPNPFNSATNISIYSPSEQKANAVLYDMLGRKIAQLYDGILSIGQSNFIADFKSNGELSSGVYFFVLTTSKQSSKINLFYIK
jgi:hypothetical protein